MKAGARSEAFQHQEAGSDPIEILDIVLRNGIIATIDFRADQDSDLISHRTDIVKAVDELIQDAAEDLLGE